MDKSCLLLTITPCCSIIDKALDCLSGHNILGACKNFRHGSETLGVLRKMVREYFGKRSDEDDYLTLYHEYMLEAAGKIAENARKITISTDKYVPVTYKCEIEIIRRSLTRLLQSADNILRAEDSMSIIREDISKEKDFIEHTIAVHSNRMNHDDYNDGAPDYTYLMLLYHLRSFISSFSQVVKNIEINNKPMTA